MSAVTSPLLLDLERAVAQDPERLAVVDERGSGWSYGALVAASAGISDRLRDGGVRGGMRCGLAVERERTLVAAVLAILELGAAYVCVEPDTPAGGMTATFASAGVDCVVASRALAPPLRSGPWDVFELEALLDASAADRRPGDGPGVSASDVAYYTAATTAIVPVVPVAHASIAELVRVAQATHPIAAGSTVLQLADVGTDVSTYELFGALLNSATALVASSETRTSPSRLAALLRRHDGGRVALLDLRSLPRLRHGPRSEGDLAAQASPPPERSRTSAQTIAVQIGWRAYVLDGARRAVAEGEIGELFVSIDGGPAHSTGYVFRAARGELVHVRDDDRLLEVAGPSTLPRTPTEERVARDVFAPVLGREDVPVDANFFELGGTSLQLLRLLANVRTAFEVTVPVGDFFADPTVGGVAAAIDAAQTSMLASVDPQLLRSAIAEVEHERSAISDARL